MKPTRYDIAILILILAVVAAVACVACSGAPEPEPPALASQEWVRAALAALESKHAAEHSDAAEAVSAQLSEIATAQQRIATALADLHAQQNDLATALARLRGCIQTPGECRGPVLVLPER